MIVIRASIENIIRAIKVIREGGVVIFPTDTVYGLVADAESKIAVKRIFKIKKRSFKKPLPVFVKDLKMAKKIANINKKQEKIIKKHWPGKATFILKAKSTKFPKGILGKDKKIGLRVPNYKLLNTLLRKINLPLAETSANISGKKAETKIREVLRQFKDKKYQPDLVLDGGNLKKSLPSAVVDLMNFKVLRKGEVLKELILK